MECGLFVSTSPSMAAAVGYYYRWANDGGSKGIAACDDEVDEVVKAKRETGMDCICRQHDMRDTGMKPPGCCCRRRRALLFSVDPL